MPSINPLWTPLAIERGRMQVALKLELLNLSSNCSQVSSTPQLQTGVINTLSALRIARRISAQRIVWQWADNYWHNLCQSIWLSADCSNTCAMHNGMEKASGPNTANITLLKSASDDIITDRGTKMDRWPKHYQKLYSRENIVTNTAVENTGLLLVMEELPSLW